MKTKHMVRKNDHMFYYAEKNEMINDIRAFLILSYIVLLLVILLAELVIAIKIKKDYKKCRFTKGEKVRKIIISLMISPFVLIVPMAAFFAFYMKANFFAVFLALFFGSWSPLFLISVVGFSALSFIKRAKNADLEKELSPGEKKRKKIRVTIVIIAGIIGMVLGVSLVLFFRLK